MYKVYVGKHTIIAEAIYESQSKHGYLHSTYLLLIEYDSKIWTVATLTHNNIFKSADKWEFVQILTIIIPMIANGELSHI